MNAKSNTPVEIQNGIISATEAHQPFPIVGIGASAGGLESFIRFFEALPDDPGMAFVLIQHLDPNHDSMMSDLLSRHTALNVLQVRERTRVCKNTVYIIPPGKFLGLEAQDLVLSEPPASRGMRMTVDHFFKTLAEIRREKAICIILSGTASDGTLGMKAVKANGGLALVQDPETAKYDGMPRSAISTGAVDRILAPEDMPEVLLGYVRHPYVSGANKDQADTNPSELGQLEKVLSVLYAKTGHEFGGYKKSTVGRRVQRRMSLNHIVRVNDYLDFIRSSEKEAQALFQDMLINVTAFFRDPEAWDALETRVLPQLVEGSDPAHPIRVWTPGCATGEEAYSIAMLLIEMRDLKEKRAEIQIFGTDIDKDAFLIARKGRYPASIAADVPPDRLKRFFDQDQDAFVIKKQLRETVVFAQQSLINDPPFSNLDLIICRNLLIYLEPEIQYKIVRLFHFALKENGYLFLGNSENLGTQKDLFEPVSKNWRIYKRLGGRLRVDIELPVFHRSGGYDAKADNAAGSRARLMSIANIAQQAVLQRYAPPAVLVDRKLELIYYQGDTTPFLKQPEGEPTRSLIDQAPASMRTKLRWLLQKVVSSGEPDHIGDVNVPQQDGHFKCVVIEAAPLKHPAEAEGLILITFVDQPYPADRASVVPDASSSEDSAAEGALQQLEYELKVTREELQATIEELETANEELKASNEEAMSMNEELQSTNEELETNKEELQSLNEELTTVNNELRAKVRELEEANNDMANLLANTHVPTIFLYRDLRIKRFTPAASELMRLVPSDIGRHFDHIARRFKDPELIDHIHTVLRDAVSSEKEVQTDERNTYIRRILPYRTQDDSIDGVVITFVDITQKRKHLDEIEAWKDQLRQANISLEKKIAARTRSLEEKSVQLQRLAAELSQVEQRERRQLAATLHDHLQQLIATSRMRLEGIETGAELPDTEHLSQIRKMLEEAAAACRDISVQLAPPVLYDAGFSAAAKWLCKWFQDQHGLKVASDVDSVSLDLDLSVMLFQSTKELLFNIVKHAGTDSAELSVKSEPDGRVCVKVTDTGAGFAPEMLAAGQSENKGFGLFSIRERIEMAAGQYEVQSTPGRGTTITLRVPETSKSSNPEDRRPQDKHQDSSHRAAAHSDMQNAVRVLIVDDHQIFREGLRSLLESKDHITVAGEAANGQEAVKKAAELMPDVILMDINMPHMNGIEATHVITAKMPQIRIIGLSVNSEDDMSEAMLAAGADAYLTKGGPSGDLLAKIGKKGTKAEAS